MHNRKVAVNGLEVNSPFWGMAVFGQHLKSLQGLFLGLSFSLFPLISILLILLVGAHLLIFNDVSILLLFYGTLKIVDSGLRVAEIVFVLGCPIVGRSRHLGRVILLLEGV